MFGIGNSSSSSSKTYNYDQSSTAATGGSAAIRGDNASVNIEDGSQEALDLADSVVAENTAAAEEATDAAENINADSLDFAGDALDGNVDLSVAALDEMGRMGGTALGEMGSTTDRAMSLADNVVGTLDGGLRTMAERTEDATKGALNWAAEVTRSDSADTMNTTIKWGAGALALVAVAWALSR
jgi:hypothetical protein